MAAILEQAEVATELRPAIAGRNPWLLAGRRLWRNRIAMAALVLFLLIVVVSLLAPLYASHIAHTNPFVNDLNGTTIVHGKRVPLMVQGGGALRLGETPIGPTWDVHHYFLGADALGRDVAARLLYGGRHTPPLPLGAPAPRRIIPPGPPPPRGLFRGGGHAPPPPPLDRPRARPPPPL